MNLDPAAVISHVQDHAIFMYRDLVDFPSREESELLRDQGALARFKSGVFGYLKVPGSLLVTVVSCADSEPTEKSKEIMSGKCLASLANRFVQFMSEAEKAMPKIITPDQDIVAPP